MDPLRHWAIKQYEAQYANKMSSSLQLTYGATGPPELQHVDFELNVAPQRSSKFSIDAANYDWNAAQNQEFTLSAFGLPEYREPFNTRRWLVFINVGIICLLLGAILWRRKQETLGRV